MGVRANAHTDCLKRHRDLDFTDLHQSAKDLYNIELLTLQTGG